LNLAFALRSWRILGGTNDVPKDDKRIGRGPELKMPKCPNGGVYIVGKLGELPKCSIGGPRHTFPSN
jgi:hypothetical protein